jgi:hypothetical protein
VATTTCHSSRVSRLGRSSATFYEVSCQFHPLNTNHRGIC